MHEIICPHCDKAFKIDESGCADIVKQVRDQQFDEQIHERLKLAEQDKLNAIELAKTQVTSQLEKTTAKEDEDVNVVSIMFEMKTSLKSSTKATNTPSWCH